MKSKKTDEQEIWKPTQKLLRLDADRVSVHKLAKTPYLIWHQLKVAQADINFASIKGYYQQPIRLIERPNKAHNIKQYYFFDGFYEITHNQTYNPRQRQPLLLYPENKIYISKLAWGEVLNLANQKNIDHPALFHAIKNRCPKGLALELMNAKKLNISAYCQFANISHDTYQNQQKQKKHRLTSTKLYPRVWIG